MRLRSARALWQAAVVLLTGLGAGPLAAVPFDPDTLPTTAAPKRDAGAAETSYRAGLGALQAGRMDDAERSFLGCLEVAPRAAACLLGLATVAEQRGNPDEGGRWIERAAAAEPDNAYVQASLGRWRAVKGRTPEAVAALEQAVQLDPKAVRPKVDLGDVYLTAGRDLDRAIKLYREAIAIDDSHAGAHYALAVALTRKGDTAGARREFARASSLSPGNPLPAMALADLYAAAGDLKEAEKYAREAVKAQPGLLNARLSLGQILEATGRYDEAMQQYQAMTKAHPKLASPYFHVGALLHRQGDLPGAARAYQQALKNDARFAPALNNLAAIELTAGKSPAKAEPLARRAVEAAPDSATYRDTLAEVLAARGELAKALAEQQQAVRLEPGNPMYLARAGQLQARLGQKDAAIASLSRALGISDSFPGAGDAKKQLSDLQR